MLEIISGNRLDALADILFRLLFGPDGVAPDAASVFARRRCVVVPTRILQGWLKQQYLYAADADAASPRIIADCDFPLLHAFVNDWLFRMDHPGAEQRDPAAHPFSRDSLCWRLYRALAQAEADRAPAFKPLLAFLDAARRNADAWELRRFQLAGRLAAVFDGYNVYRPEMLENWERDIPAGVPDELAWEQALWATLVEDGDVGQQTYRAAFRRMEQGGLARCGMEQVYSAVHVFSPSLMPRVYQVFFLRLAERLPVFLYAWNPSRSAWIAETLPGRNARAEAHLLEAGDEDSGLFDQTNPLLAGLGRGIHEFLSEWLDLTGGRSEEQALFVDPGQDSLLSRLQRGIWDNTADPVSGEPDGSIQLHVCHGPRRELEVLRDFLLHEFTTQGLQPREAQVQMPDLTLYAPYIEAVFGTEHKNAPDTIPYVIADRVLAGESPAAEGILRLLDVADSRFTSLDVLQLLQCDSIRDRFEIGANEVETIGVWLEKAGIRWGRGRTHRAEVTGVDFTEATSWRHGLDRLLAGYLFGAGAPGNTGDMPLPCDLAEGEEALLLGKLAHMVEALDDVAEFGRHPHTLSEWAAALDSLLTRFFDVTNETYRDIAVLRKAVEAFHAGADAADAGGLETGIDVVRTYLRDHLQSAVGGGETGANAVVFSALRPGSSAPRSVVCLLGLIDGAFPRRENRPAYDLLKQQRKRCDRTPRIDDRTAFFEAIGAARDTLYLSYPGYALDDGSESPPSVLVEELRTCIPEADSPVHHPLHAFDPVYFSGDASRVSYSRAQYHAARRLLMHPSGPDPEGVAAANAAPAVTPSGDTPAEADLDDLLSFFANPARYYYERILGLRLDARPVFAVSDTEEFEPDTLRLYQVRNELVKALAHDIPADDVYRVLTEEGRLPLGRWGRRWFEQQWAEASALTAYELPPWGRLADALREQAAGEQADLAAETESGRVYGTIRYGRTAPPAALDFRPVTPKAKGRLLSWLRHVFACAAGSAETRCWAEGRTAEDLKTLSLPPLSRADAAPLLRDLLRLFREGQQAPLPFAPETAFGYAEKYNAALEKENDDESQKAGLTAADTAWRPGFRTRGEGADVYLRKAFGESGPHRRESRFAELALNIWNSVPRLDSGG